MERLGLDARLKAEGLPHDGFNLADGERLIRIDLQALTGKQVTVYGQTELTRDLMDAREERGLEVIYGAADVALHDVESDAPFVTYTKDGGEQRIDCRFIVGCDGFHGPSRRAIPAAAAQEYEREYPFGWLGILADVPPCNHELIYANHARGFALASMRSETRSRYYIDVPLTEKIEDWPDERLWDELAIRLGPEAAAHIDARAVAREIDRAARRSYVFAPMRHGSLLLCGDAAHIVPPTGAKGLNLAASDVLYASEALAAFFKAQRCRCGRRLFGQGAGPGVEERTLQLVADPADAPLSGRRAVRARDAGGRARLYRHPARRRRPPLPKTTSGCRSDPAQGSLEAEESSRTGSASTSSPLRDAAFQIGEGLRRLVGTGALRPSARDSGALRSA